MHRTPLLIPVLALLALPALPLLLAGCEGLHGTGGALPRERFVEVYGEILELEAATPGPRVDSTAVDSVLARHRVTRQEILRTVEVYRQNPERWDQFYAEVVRRLEEKQRERDSTAARKARGKEPAQGF